MAIVVVVLVGVVVALLKVDVVVEANPLYPILLQFIGLASRAAGRQQAASKPEFCSGIVALSLSKNSARPPQTHAAYTPPSCIFDCDAPARGPRVSPRASPNTEQMVRKSIEKMHTKSTSRSPGSNATLFFGGRLSSMTSIVLTP